MYKLKEIVIKDLENGKNIYKYQIEKIIPASKFLWFNFKESYEDTDYGDTTIGRKLSDDYLWVEPIRGFISKKKAEECLKNLNK